MSLPNNFTPVTPSLKDLLDRYKQDLLINLNCHALGSIVVFDPSNQTATISMNYQKTVFALNPITTQMEAKQIPYPIMMDVPVVCLGGGLASLTFPILPGDECILLFNDRDIDNWFQGSTTSPVATPRLHSFSDAIAIVGVRSLPKVLTSYDSTHALLKMGLAKMGVSPTQVLISNSTSTLGSLLQTFVSDVQTLVTTLTTNAPAFIAVTGAPGGPSPLSPAIVAALAPVLTSLITLATQLSALLE